MNRNITALILIILAIGLYVTYTKGELDAAQIVQTENSQYQSALNNATQLIKYRDQVRTDYNNLSDTDRARLKKMIPDTVDNIRLVIEMNSIALKHNLTLSGVSASVSGGPRSTTPTSIAIGRQNGVTPITNATLDTVTLSFGVSTTYEEFISFLKDIESNLRIMDITHLSLSASDNGTYNYSVSLKTYWLRQ